MVKINDPRGDTAAIAMRSLRAINTFKKIKKIVKNSKSFNEYKLNLQKTDKNFFNDFISCPKSIKQELIFLWEEVGDLYEEIEDKKELPEPQETQEPDINIQLNLNELAPPPPPMFKRKNIMGP
jgi:hypothetical protein